MKVLGLVHKYGDDINTDIIIPGKYTKTLNYLDFKEHVLEDLDKEFKYKVKEGDFLVAGNNFGIGSSREQAPIAIKTSGIRCIIAKSFSRIFYRNSVNIGLTIVECNTDEINDGDTLEFDTKSSYLINKTQDKVIQVKPLNIVMDKILSTGGLVEYIKKYGKF